MSRRKWSNETIDTAIQHRSMFRLTDVTNISAPSITKIEWNCSVCDGNWLASVDSVIRGSGCSHCAGNTKQTKEVCQSRIDATSRNCIVLSLGDGKRNAERRGKFECRVCHCVWDMTLSNMFSANQGCPRCGKSGRYTTKWFNRNQHRLHISSELYLLMLTDETEQFVKVGITTRTVKNRISTSIPYTVKVLREFTLELFQAFEIEQHIITTCYKHRYLPKHKFGGRTECFEVQSTDILIHHITEKLNEIKQTK